MLSSRASRIRPSGIRKIFELASSLPEPIDLSIGQPDFEVPRAVKDAAIRAIEEGFSRYTVTEGVPELNERLRGRVRENFGFDPGASLVTAGVSGGLLLAYLALLDPGDEILIPDPYFVMYRVLADVVGAKAVCYDTHPDFRLRREELERHVTARTRVLLLNSPSNPTGRVLSEEELRVAADFAREHDLTIVSDEIYDAFVYGVRFRSACEFHERTLLLSGFSKTLGMPGWRIGYAVGPRDLIDAMKTLQQFTFVCANTIAQRAALHALDCDLTDLVAGYARKRDRVVAALAPHYELVAPDGSFYAYPRLPRGFSGAQMANAAIAEQLLIVPGTAFSPRDSHFRLSFATDDATLERGLDALIRLARAGAMATEVNGREHR